MASEKTAHSGKDSTKVRDMDDKIARKAEMFPVGSRASYLKATKGAAAPRTAIKVFCTECMGYNLADAKDCVTVECPLFRYMKRDNKGL